LFHRFHRVSIARDKKYHKQPEHLPIAA
jgi:hypothetical protein